MYTIEVSVNNIHKISLKSLYVFLYILSFSYSFNLLKYVKPIQLPSWWLHFFIFWFFYLFIFLMITFDLNFT